MRQKGSNVSFQPNRYKYTGRSEINAGSEIFQYFSFPLLAKPWSVHSHVLCTSTDILQATTKQGEDMQSILQNI